MVHQVVRREHVARELLRVERIFLRNLGDDAERLHADLVRAFDLRVLFDDASHFDARLELQMIRACERVLVDVALEDDALRDARPVTHFEKMKLAARALVVKPPTEGDFLTDVCGQFGDGGDHEDRFVARIKRV